jgi:hypothetical protein
VTDDGGYRANARAGSALLADLAARGEPTRRQLPREAADLAPRVVDALLRNACQAHGGDARVLALLVAAIIVPLVGFAGCLVAVQPVDEGLVGGMALLALLVIAAGIGTVIARSDAAHDALVERELATPARYPFPIEGYRLWLASEQPLFDVTLARPVDRGLFERALRGLDPAIGVEWVDEQTARIATPPRTRGEHRIGDRALFHRVVGELLIPLHGEVGISRVDMGGVVRRA